MKIYKLSLNTFQIYEFEVDGITEKRIKVGGMSISKNTKEYQTYTDFETANKMRAIEIEAKIKRLKADIDVLKGLKRK